MKYEEAAEWFLRMRSAEPPAEELKQWNEWLRIEENQRAFDAVTRAWRGSEPLQVQTLRSTNRFYLYGAAAALATLVLGSILWLQFSAFTFTSTGGIEVHKTAAGQHLDVRLEDGSKVLLGALTAMSVSYAPDARTIVLDRGEALFEVARDASRPFVVVAGAGTITAVGTAFNVKRELDGAVVTVTEGKVRVERPGADAVAQLADGEQLRYGSTGGFGSVHRADPQVATAWRDGKLVYRAEPLTRVVEDVNRYSDEQIVLADRAAEQLLFSGTVQQDQIDDWLIGLQDIFPLEIVRKGKNQIVLRSRAE